MDVKPVIQEARLIRHENATWLFDFGQDAFGQPIIEINGGTPGYATVSVGECVRDGWLDNAPGGFLTIVAKVFEVHIGPQTIEYPVDKHIPPAQPHTAKPLADGNILPFRYVQVSGYYIEDVKCTRKAYFGGFNDDAAQFESDNDALNTVWNFCKYSMKATNCFEFFIDGERERLPYEGDTYINQLGAFCCNTQYEKSKHTIDRLLKYRTWPIEWLLLMPVVAKDYVLYTGDTSALEDWKEGLKERLLTYAVEPDGLLPAEFTQVVNAETTRTIIDWPEPARDHTVFGPKMAVPNCYRYASLNAFAALYDDSECRAEAQNLKQIIQQNFLMPNGLYRDSIGSDHAASHSQFFAVASGVADNAQMPSFRDFVAKHGMACSVYGAQFLLDALYRAQAPDMALAMMTTPNHPGWLNMITQGATISMEAWSNADKPNQDWNHPWGAAPANIIPRRLCGILPIENGFKTVSVKPNPGNGVKQFMMKHPTPFGPLTVEYDYGKTAVKAPKEITVIQAN